MSWHLGRLVGFDTETSGVDVESDRIVTACIVEVGGDLRVLDPRVVDKHVDMYRPGKRTLTDLCAHYRVKLDGAHAADADAIAACRIMWRLGCSYSQLAEMSLDELHKAQADWNAVWAADFQAHLRRKGETDAVIDGTWPLRPVGGAS